MGLENAALEFDAVGGQGNVPDGAVVQGSATDGIVIQVSSVDGVAVQGNAADNGIDAGQGNSSSTIRLECLRAAERRQTYACHLNPRPMTPMMWDILTCDVRLSSDAYPSATGSKLQNLILLIKFYLTVLLFQPLLYCLSTN